MKDDLTIPTPDTSGSSGRQLASDPSQTLYEANPLQGLTIASAVSGLASTNSKAFGGEVSATIIGATVFQLNRENHELKMENHQLNSRIDSLRDSLDTFRTQNAVLAQKINSDNQNKHLRNFGIAVGTTMMGVGIGMQSLTPLAIGSIVAGALLLVLAWVSGSKEHQA